MVSYGKPRLSVFLCCHFSPHNCQINIHLYWTTVECLILNNAYLSCRLELNKENFILNEYWLGITI